MSRRYWPSIIGCVLVFKLISKTIVPNLGCADQPGIGSQGRQLDFYAVDGNQFAILPDHLTHAIKKQVRTLHDAAAEYDDFWSKDGNEIGQTEPQIVRLALHRALRPFLGVLCTRADFAGTEIAVRGSRRRIYSEQHRHRRPGRQTFPASARAACTGRPSGIDDVVPNLR